MGNVANIFPKLIFNTQKNEFYNDLACLPGRMKLEKVENPIGNLLDKTEYIIQIRNLKQALNHGLILTKVHREIKFNQKAWLKPYIDMNNFEKDFFKFMSNVRKCEKA